MIILEDVTKTYSSGVPALNGINLHVQKGEFVFIVGKSGSGKSTLIKLLLKELDPTTGKIYVNKKYLNKITRKKLPYLRRDIGVVFQDFRLAVFIVRGQTELFQFQHIVSSIVLYFLLIYIVCPVFAEAAPAQVRGAFC